MEPEVTAGLRRVIDSGLNDIQRTAKALAPVDTGDLRDSIVVKKSRDGLTGIAGPGANAAEIVRRRTGSQFGRTIKRGKQKGKAINLRKSNRKAYWQFLKGYWIEFGTKGSAKANIPPQPARPFMTPAYKANERRIVANVRREVNRALRRAARV